MSTTRIDPDSAARPGLIKLALEARAPYEFAAGLANLAWIRHLPRGAPHPVLVFPGLVASDRSTLLLRTLLWRLGYHPYGWEQGFNFGPRHGVVAGCRARVEELFVEHEQKLTLIGWSLGGIYAREIAKLVPECVRQVVTLGSPFKGDPRANNAYEIFRLLSGHRVDANMIARVGEKPPVPTTSIYSRSDGVVPWQASHEAEHEEAENIVVKASHLGLGFNPMALYAIADRLAQREGEWRPFERRGLKRLLFPDAFAL
jgi:pimeloyl-ACP methyl ester carboxylesterase